MDLAREVSELLKTGDGGDKAIEKMKDERYERTIFWMDHDYCNFTLLHWAARMNCNNFLSFVFIKNEKVFLILELISHLSLIIDNYQLNFFTTIT